MDDYRLRRNIENVKSDIDNIMDTLVDAIDGLEAELSKRDEQIAELEDERSNLLDIIHELKQNQNDTPTRN